MAEKKHQSTHRNYVGRRENEGTAENQHQSRSSGREPHYSAEADNRNRNVYANRSKPSSQDPRSRHGDQRGSYNPYNRPFQRPYQREQPSYHVGTYSKLNINNQSIQSCPRRSINCSTKLESDQNISSPPASEPSTSGPSSSTRSQSIVPNPGDNRTKQSSRESEKGPKIEKKDQRKFIQLVSKYPHLYDCADPSFHDKEQCGRSWTSIGKTFGISADTCKSKWQTIRTKYRRNTKKRADGDPLSKEAEQFLNDMSFLTSTRSSIQEKATPSTKPRHSDQPLIDAVAAELRRLSAHQKALFKSRIHDLLSEFSKVV